MIDEFAKGNLHGRLRRDRKALLWKLDGLSEYDAHAAFDSNRDQPPRPGQTRGHRRGQVLRRGLRPPFPGTAAPMAGLQRQRPVGDRGRDPRSDHRVLPAHVGTLGRDDQRASPRRPGHVPWWREPHPNTNLFAIMVHVLGESIRHTGHADILREGLDGRTGVRAEHEKQIDEEARAAYCAKIEQAARSAAPIKAQGSSHVT